MIIKRRDIIKLSAAVRLPTVLTLLLASSTAAMACSGGFLQAVLFHIYPEARSASTAIGVARQRGMLAGDEWSKNTGRSIHAWRTEKCGGKLKVIACIEHPNTSYQDRLF